MIIDMPNTRTREIAHKIEQLHEERGESATGRVLTLLIATEDGSLGTRGFVTDCIRALPECDYVYTCGPLPMLKAVHQLPQLTGGQFSFEARMGCGFGACMGCSVPTGNGYKRVCKDGPILYKEEIVW